MTATPVEFVLDELGAVVDAQPPAHPLRRVDRDNALVYEEGGAFDMTQSMQQLQDRLTQANYVGARFADRESEYIGTKPDLDLEEVVGVRIIGYSGSAGHVDPHGNSGVVFQGTDESLVRDCMDTLYNALAFPDAGRTPVSFTHLTITNEESLSAAWADFHRYDFDIAFSGFESL